MKIICNKWKIFNMGKVRKSRMYIKCQLKHNAYLHIQFFWHYGDIGFMQTFVVGGLRVHKLPKYVTSKEFWIEVTDR
jgi:hypothetical protein